MSARSAAPDEGGFSLSTIATQGAGGLLVALHGQDAGGLGIPAPYACPICLVPSTRVAGTTHVSDIARLAQGLGEGARLRLQRDADNRYDQWSIRVLDARGRRLGFVPADHNQILARLMDGGKRLFATVTQVSQVDGWTKIEMAVYLDD